MNTDNRRDFIKKSALLAGSMGLSYALPESIQRALAINPDPGTTYLDAEHIVMIMLENRSFDHCFGTLKGVRGFNDPRALTLPNGNPVWLQTNAIGQTFAPFRLDIKGTKSTWIAILPHSRHDQVDAFNFAKFDKWLDAKPSSIKQYRHIPFTLGYHNREDLPFNYAMADAFTVCDQNFCSSMTSTHPNRLYFWTGTIRDPRYPESKAYIRNPDLKTGKETWVTFPERLEDHGVSWKIYQNDLACGGGFKDDERSWLSNYNCNPLEFFPRYNVKFSKRNIESLQKLTEVLPQEIKALQDQLVSMKKDSPEFKKASLAIDAKMEVLDKAKEELKTFSAENYQRLSEREKNLYERAFSTNVEDPDFHKMTSVKYTDQGKEKEFSIPEGDLFYNFRKDVNSGRLPTVSWMVAPHYCSDHPSVPMYGPSYISEILDILTKNEEIWKKTIFIVTYDENDGYFDHVPPFMSQDISNPESGKCSKDIDPLPEYISLEDELGQGISQREARGFPIGLGYRVPLIIASPWSKGGKVCSQVFDHTSSLRFVEHFVNKKFGVNLQEENISKWRRAICGDLTAAFSPYYGDKNKDISFLNRNELIEAINKAKSKPAPTEFRAFTPSEIEQAKKDPASSSLLPQQEKGVSISCALPYELYVDGKLNRSSGAFEIRMEAANRLFGASASGSPFSVYARGNYLIEKDKYEQMRNWQYAVSAGDVLTDQWPLASFESNAYELELYGPNGFYRRFSGDRSDPFIDLRAVYEYQDSKRKALTGNIILIADIDGKQKCEVEIVDWQNGRKQSRYTLSEKSNQIVLNLQKSFGWYDFEVKIAGNTSFSRRYAGHVETGKNSFTDPVMGGL